MANDNIIDIFQELFDDFPELGFEFDENGYGNVFPKSRNWTVPPKIRSKIFNSEIFRDRNLSYELMYSLVHDYGNKIVPYLEEANDRLGDFNLKCSHKISDIIQLRSKFSNIWEIVINIDIKSPSPKIKSFEKFNENKILSKSEKEEIEFIMQDFMDEFNQLEFKVKKENITTIKGLISLESNIFLLPLNYNDYNVSDIKKQLLKVQEFLDDNECIDRMENIGYDYLMSQISKRIDGDLISVFFIKRSERINEDFTLSKNEKEDIEYALMDFFDDFRNFNFKIYNYPPGENKDNLLVIQSDINTFPFREYLEAEKNIADYLDNSECVDRMEELGYRYSQTLHGGDVVNIFFKKIEHLSMDNQ